MSGMAGLIIGLALGTCIVKLFVIEWKLDKLLRATPSRSTRKDTHE